MNLATLMKHVTAEFVCALCNNMKCSYQVEVLQNDSTYLISSFARSQFHALLEFNLKIIGMQY